MITALIVVFLSTLIAAGPFTWSNNLNAQQITMGPPAEGNRQPPSDNPAGATTPPVLNTPAPAITPSPPDAPTANEIPPVTNAPPTGVTPSLVPSVTIAPGVIPPSVSVSKATVIDNTIYAKTGQVIEFTANNSASFRVGFLSINGALLDQTGEAMDNAYYTITVPVNNDYKINALVIKGSVEAGIKIPIVAVSVNMSMITNQNQDNYYIDNSKSIRVIPSDSAGAVKGGDGKIYLKYDSGVYREFPENGPIGPDISSLP